MDPTLKLKSYPKNILFNFFKIKLMAYKAMVFEKLNHILIEKNVPQTPMALKG